MAYDFLGLAHRYQVDALIAFVDNQIAELDPTDPTKSDRRQALRRKIDALRRTLDGFQVAHAMTAGDKLPYFNREKNEDGTFKYKPAVRTLQNDHPMLVETIGEHPIAGQAKIEWLPDESPYKPVDMVTAQYVGLVKSAFRQQIQHRKERLEYRQRRLYDQIDRLYKELAVLQDIWPVTDKSRRAINEIVVVDAQFSDPTFNGVNLFDGNVFPYTDRGIPKRISPELQPLDSLTEGA